MRRYRTRSLTVLLVAVVGLAACDTPEDEPAETEPLEEGGDDPFLDEEEGEPRPDDGVDEEATDTDTPLLATASSDEHGEYLTDGEGYALYVSAQDPPGESLCTDACVEQWPVTSVEDDREPGDGVDAELVGSLDRDDLPGDEVEQLTYRDKPLHYHVQDESPGEVTGQGADDTWFLISPDGVEIRD